MTIKEQIQAQYPKAYVKDKGFVFKKGIGATARLFLNEIAKEDPSHVFYIDTNDNGIKYIDTNSLNLAVSGSQDEIKYDSEYNGSYFFSGKHIKTWEGSANIKSPAMKTTNQQIIDSWTVPQSIVVSKGDRFIQIIRELEKQGVDFEVKIEIK